MTTIKSTFHFVHKSIGKATHSKQAASGNVFYITRDDEVYAIAKAAGENGRDVIAGERDIRGFGEASAAQEAVGYNARDSAASVIMAGRMPEDRTEAARWLDQRAAADRANGRVADTFIMSLPRELSREQNAELVRDWCETATKGKAAYFAAIHDKGKDAQNPHAHVIIRDRDYSRDYDAEKKRPRVIGTSTGKKEIAEAERRGVAPPPRATSYDLRQSWAEATNRHLERAGFDVRVDHRSYKERGIDRQAGIHVGRALPKMQEKGIAIQSRDVERGARLLPYSVIDDGTRAEHNARIKAANERRELLRDTARTGLEITVTPEQRARKQAEREAGGTVQPFLREERERAQLQEEQGKDRVAMLSEQRQDMASLLALHRAEREALKAWGRDLSAGLQDRVFAATGDQFKARWSGLDGMAEGPEKQAAARVLRDEQAAATKAAIAAAKAEAKAAKETRRADLLARQLQERNAVRDAHKTEQRLTTLQHKAERDALTGKWDAVHLRAATGWAEARFSGSQSMASVQTKAAQMALMRERFQRAQARPMHPDEHQRVAEQRGRDAIGAKRERAALRGELYAGREVSERRQSATLRGELLGAREMTERLQRLAPQAAKEQTDSRAGSRDGQGKGEGRAQSGRAGGNASDR